ncbi:MAG: Gfo/Idh/MocA family protein [Candidatus Hodarchaeota archaeon]
MAKTKKTAVIIGFGSAARGWYREIKKNPSLELIGIVDTDTELLENLGKMVPELDEDQGYISIEDAVRYGEKPDLAVVVTPIPTHAGLVKETMDLGINVIVEKNMASTVPQGRQLVQYAIDNPELCTAVGTQYRFMQPVWTAHEYFASGRAEETIGELGMIVWEDYGWRGNKRWKWRRFLQDIYLEDMSVHWFDSMRFITGMDIVQVKADTFMPRYSNWHGSSSVFANLALAKPEDYNDRHKWVWCHFAGDWQRGPMNSDFEGRREFYGKKGFAKGTLFGVEINIYKDMTNISKDFEQDAFLSLDAGPIAGLEGNIADRGVILEQMVRGIDSGGEKQPDTNFKEAFKSFAVAMACRDSSLSGNTIWVPDYWKNMLD